MAEPEVKIAGKEIKQKKVLVIVGIAGAGIVALILLRPRRGFTPPPGGGGQPSPPPPTPPISAITPTAQINPNADPVLAAELAAIQKRLAAIEDSAIATVGQQRQPPATIIVSPPTFNPPAGLPAVSPAQAAGALPSWSNIHPSIGDAFGQAGGIGAAVGAAAAASADISGLLSGFPGSSAGTTSALQGSLASGYGQLGVAGAALAGGNAGAAADPNSAGVIADVSAGSPENLDSPRGQTYTVQPGDSLWGIAKRFGISFDDLSAVNPQITDLALIFPGQLVNVP